MVNKYLRIANFVRLTCPTIGLSQAKQIPLRVVLIPCLSISSCKFPSMSSKVVFTGVSVAGSPPSLILNNWHKINKMDNWYTTCNCYKKSTIYQISVTTFKAKRVVSVIWVYGCMEQKSVWLAHFLLKSKQIHNKL